MALIGMSEDLYVNAFVTCIICKQRVLSVHATAGADCNNGQHAFACNQHVSQRSTWITTWAQLNSQSLDGNCRQPQQDVTI